MSTTIASPVDQQVDPTASVPLSRVIGVELRKMFDTRSGFWLMASIVIAALLSTVATILFAPEADLTHYTYAKAIGFPMTVLLPVIAILSITGEWSQRTGLTTFTLVPRRTRVIGAKVIAAVAVGISSMVLALVVGVLGNLVGTAITDTDLVWDVSVGHSITIMMGSLVSLLTGTALGILFRSSPVALVVYFVYAFAVPNISAVLASAQGWCRDLQPWVDVNLTQTELFEGTMSSTDWAHLGVAVTMWLVLPAAVGLGLLAKSEVL